MAQEIQVFVIYHITSTVQVGPMKNGQPHSLYAKPYKTEGSANLTCAKFNKRVANSGKVEYAVADVETYRTKIVHQVERVNLMSGKTYKEPSNTLRCCSPASETYWST